MTAFPREAGIATPSIYRHFSDLGHLVEAAVADRFQRLHDPLADAMETSTDPARRLRAHFDAYRHFGLEHPGHYQVLFSASLGLDPARPGERVFERLVAAVDACIVAGVAQQADPHVMAVSVWVALHGIVSLRTSRPNHAWPAGEAPIDAVLSGQAGLPRG